MTEHRADYEDSARVDCGSLPQRPRSAMLVQQRLSNRYPMPAQVTVECLNCYQKLHEMPKRFWVTTRDISASGICFRDKRIMYYGEQVRLDLRMEGGDVRSVQARVVRCRRQPDGSFEIGATFEKDDAAAIPPAEPKDAPVDGADV